MVNQKKEAKEVETEAEAEVIRKMANAFRRPFPANTLLFRVGSKSTSFAYVDARIVMERLDSVAKGNWETSYTTLNINGTAAIECHLTINGLVRSDVASIEKQANANIDPVQAAYSNALKRAAVQFGIGRYLYFLPNFPVKLPVNQGGKEYIDRETLRALRSKYNQWLNTPEVKRVWGEPLKNEHLWDEKEGEENLSQEAEPNVNYVSSEDFISKEKTAAKDNVSLKVDNTAEDLKYYRGRINQSTTRGELNEVFHEVAAKYNKGDQVYEVIAKIGKERNFALQQEERENVAKAKSFLLQLLKTARSSEELRSKFTGFIAQHTYAVELAAELEPQYQRHLQYLEKTEEIAALKAELQLEENGGIPPIM